jgi:hypothetical protein
MKWHSIVLLGLILATTLKRILMVKLCQTFVSSGNLEATVQSILEMGGGAWDQGTVVQAL